MYFIGPVSYGTYYRFMKTKKEYVGMEKEKWNTRLTDQQINTSTTKVLITPSLTNGRRYVSHY